jgi:hypothetical protein
MRRIVLVVIASLLSGSSPAPAQPVRELWSTKGGPQLPFGEITGVVALNDGSIVVADEQAGVLLRVAAGGGRVALLARKGSGPGEVRHPTLLAAHPSGGFVVYDLGHRALNHYAADGQARSRIPLQRWVTNPKGLATLSDGAFVVTGGMFGNASSVHRFDPNGAYRGSVFPAPISRDPIVALHIAGGPVRAVPGGGFLYSNSAPHEIRHFTSSADTAGRLVARDPTVAPSIVDRFASTRVEGDRTITTYQWFYSQSRAVFMLDDNSILNVITRQYDGDSIWEVWSRAGDLLSRRSVPRAYRPWDRTGRGTVLATYRDPLTDEVVLTELEFRR